MGAVARAQLSSQDHLIRVIANEFREMPGLRLTRLQFRRLWNLGVAECEDVVRELVARDYLAEGADGRLGRRSELR
jgi:hypothetical protein